MTRTKIAGFVSILTVVSASLSAAAELPEPLLDMPDAQRLRAWHDLLGAEPHISGTEGDARVIAKLMDAFADMGLEVERNDFWAYLAKPRSAQVQVVTDDGPIDLPLVEDALAADPDSGHADRLFGFNAYSGSGDVTGELVYANYGRLEDFRELEELGVDCTGRIVITRYGGNYRGYKARFAEAAGAAAVLIYTDPADAGYVKGLPYPEGGWANGTSIQRGSIKTTAYPGDPLTPFVEATKDAPRIDPATADLPRIPVQPIGWDAANQVMSRMRGRALPQELIKDWQGGLPFAYRLEGGPDARVRVAVRQDREIIPTSNVIGTLRGSTHPEQLVIIGCHHDAWGFGASDPLAGLIVLMETARNLSELAKRGERPARSIAFAAWGAEEWGIIGSTEWCEANRDELSENGVAYINLDAAAMGLDFGASAAPLLKTVIEEVAAAVTHPSTDKPKSVRDAWIAGNTEASFGNLGGGSDHIGFYCHLGIPSCGLGAGGSHGTAYHSNYDTLHWYRQVVGDDYESARMIARITNGLTWRLADDPLLPLDPARYVTDLRAHTQTLRELAQDREFELDFTALDAAINELDATIRDSWSKTLRAAETDAALAARVNAMLLQLERCWLDEEGLPDRPWFRNLFAASDEHSGYAAWMLPALRRAVDRADTEAAGQAMDALAAIVGGLSVRLGSVGDARGG